MISFIRQLLDRIFVSMRPSVGNLDAIEGRKAMEPVFQTALFFAQWIYGIAAICMYELFQPFIELSFGPRFLLDSTVVCAVVGDGLLLAVYFRRPEFKSLLWELRTVVKKISNACAQDGERSDSVSSNTGLIYGCSPLFTGTAAERYIGMAEKISGEKCGYSRWFESN